MNGFEPQPVLAFPGLEFLTDVANISGAVGRIANDIVANITGWILTSAFSIFGFAIDIAFSNDGVIAGCTANTVEQCSQTSFVTDTFQRSLTISVAIAAAALLYAVIKTVVSGDPGQIARKALLDAPRIIITSVFILQGTILVMLITDEVAAFMTSPSLGPARDEYFAGFNAQQLIENPQSIEHASFVVALLGALLTVGSIFLWIIMMLRSVVIALLLAIAPIIAALAIGGNGDGWNRLIRLLFAIITSKVIIVIVLSLGVSAMLQIPFVQQGLNPDAVVTAPPIEPGEDGDIGNVEVIAAGFEMAYQLVTGVLLIFAAAFSPMLILQLLPDSVEQYYAFGNAEQIHGRQRHRMAAPIRRRIANRRATP